MGCQADLWILRALSTGNRRGLTNQAGCANLATSASVVACRTRKWRSRPRRPGDPAARPGLAHNEHVPGPDHPSTLESPNNLALAYWEAGRAAEALPLFEQTLPDREQVLGPDHPDTPGSRNNLATAYHQAGARAR